MKKLKISFNRWLLAAALLTSPLASLADQFSEFKKSPDADKAFKYLHQVATHPRCANCHGVVDNGIHHPTVGDERRPHPMNITSLNNLKMGFKDGEFVQLGEANAINCRGCHQNDNGKEPGMPPGAANDLMPGFVWHMPPPTMAIEPGLSAQELCNNWLNPAKNSFLAFRGSRHQMDIFKKEFEHHVKDDPLVRWAWQPGPERTPAPGTHEDFVKAMKIWIKAGAPCPSA